MTREEIEAQYAMKNGIITSPGKFEGEPIYGPYFYDCASDGEELSYMTEGCGIYVSLVDITAEDKEMFPELGDAKYIAVTENDQGFVSITQIHSEARADQWREEYSNEDEDEDEEYSDEAEG